MNQNIHYSAEIVTLLIVVGYFQMRYSSVRDELDKHKKQYEADMSQLENAINNIYAQLSTVQQEVRSSVMLNMPPQSQQYSVPPQARMPMEQGTHPNYHQSPTPNQSPMAQQQQRPQSRPQAPPSPPPRGSRQQFMGEMGPGQGGAPMSSGVAQAVRNVQGGVSAPRQMPGMPPRQDIQQPSHQPGNYDIDDDNGPSSYGLLGGNEDEQNFMTSGKKGSLKSMAASIQQQRDATIASLKKHRQEE